MMNKKAMEKLEKAIEKEELKMKIKGWMEIVDDYGEHRYRVSRIENGCYYFVDKTLLENNRLRYNEREERIEEFLPKKGYWDVFNPYIYQASFLQNN